MKSIHVVVITCGFCFNFYMVFNSFKGITYTVYLSHEYSLTNLSYFCFISIYNKYLKFYLSQLKWKKIKIHQTSTFRHDMHAYWFIHKFSFAPILLYYSTQNCMCYHVFNHIHVKFTCFNVLVFYIKQHCILHFMQGST